MIKEVETKKVPRELRAVHKNINTHVHYVHGYATVI